MLKKLCSYPGCHKVVEAGVKYCDRHKDTDREKYREYKRKRMENEEEARRQQLLRENQDKSNNWKRIHGLPTTRKKRGKTQQTIEKT